MNVKSKSELERVENMEINEHVEPAVDPLRSNSSDSGSFIPHTRDYKPRNSPVANSYSHSNKIRFSAVREILKSKARSEYRGIGDIDDWFEQFEIVIEDMELSDKEKIHLLKKI